MNDLSKKKQENKPEEAKNEKVNDKAETVEKELPEQTPEEKLSEELAAEKDKYLRLLAEYDNFRKRSQKEREALYTDVRSDTILKLWPVFDNLERALKLQTADEAFYKGVEMTMTQLLEIFEKMGVKEIPALGEKFDPEKHNAVMHIEDENFGENVIAEEFQKGFMLGDKVIRFSMVKVAN